MSEIEKKPIKITETILRDAHQSLIATRMTTEQMLPIVETMDKVGYHSVECWGGATFDASLRFLHEDPWERLRKFRDGFKHTKLQMLFRGQNILGYRPYADDVVEYFVQKSIANGIDIIRIFDCLNDLRNLETAVKAANKENGHAQVALSYTLGDAYTLDYWTKTAKEIEELFRIIRQLKADGCGIVYISHRLEELKAIVDRVTIMRDGQYITDGNFADMTMEQIIANMVGREIKEQFPRVSCPKGKKIFEVKNLNAGHLVRDINFSLYEGEIVGFAGLMGAGRTETTRAIFGVDPKTSGEIWLDGKEVKITCPMDAIKAGIVLAPEDRKKDGLCTKLSIRHNLALPNLDLICSKLGVISSKKEDDLCEKAVKDLLIKTPTVEVNAGNLSGGNQQKVVVGKWLARNSRVVIFDEPTRGIDVGAKVEIYNLMNQLKKQGIAVMFVSSEMPEVLGIADRVIVMCDGKITGEVMAKETSQNEVLKFATEFEKKQQVS